MNNSYFKSGEWNAICDVCGFKFKSGQMKKRWDGLMVCEADWETRHPMDFLKSREEKAKPEWTRPEPTDTFTDVTYIEDP